MMRLLCSELYNTEFRSTDLVNAVCNCDGQRLTDNLRVALTSIYIYWDRLNAGTVWFVFGVVSGVVVAYPNTSRPKLELRSTLERCDIYYHVQLSVCSTGRQQCVFNEMQMNHLLLY